MRCPKCHYISFDTGDRCRNCGYEFSLAVDVKALDLPIQTGNEPIGPLDDLSLADLDRDFRSAARSECEVTASDGFGASAVGQHLHLPLFKERVVDADAPRVPSAPAPRPPVAVRWSSPAVPLARSQPAPEELQLEFRRPEYLESPEPERDELDRSRQAPEGMPAPVGHRAFAAMIDGLILGTIDLAVLYFTLRLCGLQLSDVAVIPPVPFCAFLLLINGGYFVSFTAAGGQTIGKMAAGIKVVPVGGSASWPDRVPLGHAVLRAAAYLISVGPAGLGMLPAFFSADGRAVHDRLADTRVIRA